MVLTELATRGGAVERETIQARSIELVDKRGEVSLTLDGGEGDREPGIIVYGPRGPESAVTILVWSDTGRPYIMAYTAAGSVVLLTFDQNGDPEVHLRHTDGIDQTLGLYSGVHGH